MRREEILPESRGAQAVDISIYVGCIDVQPSRLRCLCDTKVRVALVPVLHVHCPDIPADRPMDIFPVLHTRCRIWCQGSLVGTDHLPFHWTLARRCHHRTFRHLVLQSASAQELAGTGLTEDRHAHRLAHPRAWSTRQRGSQSTHRQGTPNPGWTVRGGGAVYACIYPIWGEGLLLQLRARSGRILVSRCRLRPVRRIRRLGLRSAAIRRRAVGCAYCCRRTLSQWCRSVGIFRLDGLAHATLLHRAQSSRDGASTGSYGEIETALGQLRLAAGPRPIPPRTTLSTCPKGVLWAFSRSRARISEARAAAGQPCDLPSRGSIPDVGAMILVGALDRSF